MKTEKGITWRPVLGFGKEYSERYQVSSSGEIRSLCGHNGKKAYRRREPKILRQRMDRRGYSHVGIYNGSGKGKSVQVHRVVLMSFDRLPCEGEEASHLNGKRSDNRLSNLIWESKRANEHRKREHGTFRHASGEDHGSAKLTEGQVREIKKRLGRGETGASMASRFNVSRNTISLIKLGRIWRDVV